MGTLLQAGLPVLEALSSLKDSGTLRPYSKIYTYLHDEIQDGRSFEECFSINKKIKKYIPGPIQSLISVGERSGSLGKIFLNISENFEAKTELTTKNLSVILEPLLLVIVWLGVVAVALAVILPIYSLVGGLSNKPTTGRGSSTNVATVSNSTSNKSAAVSSSTAISHLPIATSSIIIVGPKSSTSTTTATPSSNILPVIVNNQVLEVATNSFGFVNIRAASSSKAALVRKANIGERLNFVERQDGWYKIILGTDLFGWVSAQYVFVVTSTP